VHEKLHSRVNLTCILVEHDRLFLVTDVGVEPPVRPDKTDAGFLQQACRSVSGACDLDTESTVTRSVDLSIFYITRSVIQRHNFSEEDKGTAQFADCSPGMESRIDGTSRQKNL